MVDVEADGPIPARSYSENRSRKVADELRTKAKQIGSRGDAQ